jgi:endonuclease YncB( thermonuclease family)
VACGSVTKSRSLGWRVTIDAPETAQRCASAGRLYRCGIRATLHLKSLAEGRQVRCVGSKLDRYGRLVARCFVGSIELGAAMVLAGHAMAYLKYSEEYAHLESAARSGLSGIWAGEFQAPWDWRKAQRAGRTR